MLSQNEGRHDIKHDDTQHNDTEQNNKKTPSYLTVDADCRVFLFLR